MKIRQYQEKVDKWIKEYGVRYFDEKTNTIILMEEIGEFSRYIARIYGEQSFKREEEARQAKALLEDEMGDIFFVLTCLANQMGIDLEHLLKANFEKKTNRDKGRHVKNKKLN